MTEEYTIKELLQSQPYGIVLLSSWLNMKGHGADLISQYKIKGCLESIGHGAMKRPGDLLKIEGALFVLQKQLNKSIHIGGKSALTMLGICQDPPVVSKKELILFYQAVEDLPKWFINYRWEQNIRIHQSNFLPRNQNMVDQELEAFNISISDPIRALFECLYLAKNEQSLMECFEIMKMLDNLDHVKVQDILEKCNCTRVKRQFLLMAKEADNKWLNQINYNKIVLGKERKYTLWFLLHKVGVSI